MGRLTSNRRNAPLSTKAPAEPATKPRTAAKESPTLGHGLRTDHTAKGKAGMRRTWQGK